MVRKGCKREGWFMTCTVVIYVEKENSERGVKGMGKGNNHIFSSLEHLEGKDGGDRSK
jgi:hypothetical protein